MRLIERAIWFVEWRRESAFTLEEAAEACGVTRHHLARAFQAATGRPLMAYARGRRLTEAARLLAEGEGDILGLALASGYGSHEAFTRAFRAEFGLTPEAVRRAGSTATLTLTETHRMDDTMPIDLKAPRFADRAAFAVAGLAQRFTFADRDGIPTLWSRFAPWIGAVPGQVGEATYGLCTDTDGEGFTYLAGVEIRRPDDVPGDLLVVSVPAARYAVFVHEGHIAGIRATTDAIWSRWLPGSGLKPAGTPDFELYGGRFDPASASGIVEIWVPLAP